MKRLFSILLSLALILTCIPVMAFADDTSDDEDMIQTEESSSDWGEDQPEVDEFDSFNQIWYCYNERDPYDDIGSTEHYHDGVFSITFQLDGSSVYYIRSNLYDPLTDESFKDGSADTTIWRNKETLVEVSNDSDFRYAYSSAELGEAGDYITIELQKSAGFTTKSEYWLEVKRYKGFLEDSEFKTNCTLPVNDYTYAIDPTVPEDENYYYKADYYIEDPSIADIVPSYGVDTVELYVKTKKAGETVITATLPNGKEYRCILTVVAGLKYMEKTIYLNQSFKNLVYNAKGTVKWSTSNKTVATVSSKGVIKGKKKGKATITAKTGGKTYKCVVTVKNPVMAKSSIKPIVGQKYKLTVKGASGKIKWSSSDKSVATVSSSGNVTAKKAGTCTITAVCSGIKTTCKVKVYKWLTLNHSSYDLLIGADGENETVQLAAYGGFTEASWTSDDESVATVDADGFVRPVAAGTTVIKATRDGHTAKCTVKVESYDNAVYASPADCEYFTVDNSMLESDDGEQERPLWIKFRPEKTGLLKIQSHMGQMSFTLCNSKGKAVSSQYSVVEGEKAIYGVRAGKYYYLVVDSVWNDPDAEYSPYSRCSFSLTTTGVTNKCGYTKKTAKKIAKKKAIKGVFFAGEPKNHWYKITLKTASKIKVYFKNMVPEGVLITVYQGSKPISYEGDEGGRYFEYEESDTLYSPKKLSKGTYYIKIDNSLDDTSSGYYTLKWW